MADWIADNPDAPMTPDEIEALVQRRERVIEAVRPCPACGSKQVRLDWWRDNPVPLRCRMCRHAWTMEVR